MAHPIGETARGSGSFWMKKGEVTLNQMKKGMKAGPNLILQTIGWLAREDKVFDRASFRVQKKKGNSCRKARIIFRRPNNAMKNRRNWQIRSFLL